MGVGAQGEAGVGVTRHAGDGADVSFPCCSSCHCGHLFCKQHQYHNTERIFSAFFCVFYILPFAPRFFIVLRHNSCMKATTPVKASKRRGKPALQPTISKQEAEAISPRFAAFRRPPCLERPALPDDVKPGVGARQPTSPSPACNCSCPNRPPIRRKNEAAVSDIVLVGTCAHKASPRPAPPSLSLPCFMTVSANFFSPLSLSIATHLVRYRMIQQRLFTAHEKDFSALILASSVYKITDCDLTLALSR